MTSKRGRLEYVFNNAGIAIGGGAVATYAQTSLVACWTSTSAACFMAHSPPIA
jgi:hypothetical protein